MTITGFLLARIAEDEEDALEAAGWDRSGTTRLAGRWAREGVASIRDDEGGYVVYSDNGQVSGHVADYVARHDPARVLAECEAKRWIVEEHADTLGSCSTCCEEWGNACTGDNAQPFESPCPTLRALASVYADHPDFREEWRP